jgi:predicted DNA-binding protein (UPF0251 family)
MKRRIHRGLRESSFLPVHVPKSGLEELRLPLDGLEALRLADLERLYHEEAARRMGVSRATFARILASARSAVADALVHGKAVHVDGGPVEPHTRNRWPCPVHDGERRRGRGCRCDGPDVSLDPVDRRGPTSRKPHEDGTSGARS